MTNPQIAAKTTFTFTFTFICHPGKTHNHRSRGDTSRRAQTAQKHTQKQTHKGAAGDVPGGEHGGEKGRERQQAVLAQSQPLPARTYRWQPAAFAPRSLPIGLTRHFSRGIVAFLHVPARLSVGSQLRCLLARQEMWIPRCARVAAFLGVIIGVAKRVRRCLALATGKN